MTTQRTDVRCKQRFQAYATRRAGYYRRGNRLAFDTTVEGCRRYAESITKHYVVIRMRYYVELRGNMLVAFATKAEAKQYMADYAPSYFTSKLKRFPTSVMQEA